MSSEPSSLFIHIGYPRTGTTSLQSHFFSRHDDIFYGGLDFQEEPHYSHPELKLLFEYDIRSAAELAFDYRHAQAVMGKFYAGFEESGRKAALISCESLSCSWMPGEVDAALKLGRLKAISPVPPRIIIVVREQVALLRSLYADMVRRGGGLSINEFFENQLCFREMSALPYLAYDRMVNLCQTVFGEDNVHVMVYEDFKANSVFFLHALCQTLGVDPTASLSGVPVLNGSEAEQIATMRGLNTSYSAGYGLRAEHDRPNADRYLTDLAQLRGRRADPSILVDRSMREAVVNAADQMITAGLGLAPQVLNPSLAEEVRRLFAPDNANLAARLGLDLAGYGYAMAAEAFDAGEAERGAAAEGHSSDENCHGDSGCENPGHDADLAPV